MRPVIVPLIVALALAVAAAPASATIITGAVDELAGGPQTISFVAFQFTPKTLAVSPGTTSWSGALTSHPLTFDDGSPGASTGVHFQRDLTPGIVRYHCGIHGGPNGLGMSGVVYVAGPAAKLVASPASLTAPGTVTLDASGTDFIDLTANTTASYSFDTDGDGTFETTGGSPATQATFQLGTHTARVRVTDDDGRAGEAAVTVRVGEQPAAGPPGDGTPPGGGGGPAAPGAVDSSAPTLRVRSAAGLRLGDLAKGRARLLPGTLSERARVRADLRLRGRVIARATTFSAGPGELRLTLRATAAGRRALRGLRRAWLVLSLELTDAAGNRRVLRRSFSARR